MPYCPQISQYTDNPEDIYCRFFNYRLKTEKDREFCKDCRINPNYIEKVFKEDEKSVWDEN